MKDEIHFTMTKQSSSSLSNNNETMSKLTWLLSHVTRIRVIAAICLASFLVLLPLLEMQFGSSLMALDKVHFKVEGVEVILDGWISSRAAALASVAPVS